LRKKTKKELAEERKLRAVGKCFESHGIAVRRENLSRGHAFRVKSGSCLVSGKDVIFLDRRLPIKQQVSLLLDFLVDSELELSEEELEQLPDAAKALLQQASAA